MTTASTREIDAVDRRLVELLRLDGRASNRELARELGVTEVTVAARLKRLETDGVMRVVALTDIERCGYGYLAFARIQVTGRPATEVAEAVANLPQALSVTVITGHFDVLAFIIARDGEELAGLIDGTLPALDGVSEIAVELALKALRFNPYWGWLGGPHRPATPELASPELDVLDHAIIGELQVDGRRSNRRIAAGLGTSEATVRHRIRRMEGEGFIALRAVTDVIAGGVGATAWIGIRCTSGSVAATAEVLLAYPEVSGLFRSLGAFDYVAVLIAPTRDALLEVVVDGIGAHPEVAETETFESWRLTKYSYTWVRLLDEVAR